MNFKKRSEMCKPEKKDTGTVFSGDIMLKKWVLALVSLSVALPQSFHWLVL